MSQRKHKPASDYLSTLPFAYFTTYSFNRGPQLDEFMVEAELELKLVKGRLKTAPLKEKLHLQKQLTQLESTVQLLDRLTDASGQLHPTAVAVKTVRAASEEAVQFKSILTTKIKSIPNWMCTPHYRDAIAFYNEQDQLLSVLNICFECEYVQDEKGVFIDVDNSVYAKMSTFLSQLGHPIEVEPPHRIK